MVFLTCTHEKKATDNEYLQLKITYESIFISNYALFI